MFYLVSCFHLWLIFFFFNDTATTEIYTLSLHDALPISIATNATASHRFVVQAANTTGTTANALTNNAVLRLLFSVHPCRRNADESQPPLMLPSVAPV